MACGGCCRNQLQELFQWDAGTGVWWKMEKFCCWLRSKMSLKHGPTQLTPKTATTREDGWAVSRSWHGQSCNGHRFVALGSDPAGTRKGRSGRNNTKRKSISLATEKGERLKERSMRGQAGWAEGSCDGTAAQGKLGKRRQGKGSEGWKERKEESTRMWAMALLL